MKRGTIAILPVNAGRATDTSASTISSALIGLREPPPLSLYIHLPWCVRKCPYCDFNSHEARGEIPQEAYVDALIADAQGALPLVWGRPIHTVFLGGGTPSLFAPRQIARLFDGLRALLGLRPDIEITLEANPGATDAAHLAGFAAAGINRLSIGVQSFDDHLLTAIGRIHSADEASAIVRAANGLFERVNVDLMHALPGQTAAQAVADVDRAIDLGAGHVSAYQLTLEPNTAFAATPPSGLPDADASAEIAEAVEARLDQAGFEHYETSAHARRGQQCQHNLNYWTFGDYLGIGAGAHSKLTLQDRIVRQARPRHPRSYLERAAGGLAMFEAETDVAADDLPFEFAMNALRLHGGFPTRLFTERTGLPWAVLWTKLKPAIAQGLVGIEGARVVPTPMGRRHLNTLLAGLLP